MTYARRYREHVVEVDHGIVFYFNEIKSLFNILMLCLSGGQWGKIIQIIDTQDDTDVFPFVVLTRLLVRIQVRSKGF